MTDSKQTWPLVKRLAGRNLVRPFPTKAVSRRSDAEVDPRSLGLELADVEAMWRSVEALYETRLHPALSFCLRHRGGIILDRAIGHVRGNAPEDPPGAPLVQATPKTLFNLFSASKAITAMVLHHLDERGLVHVDDFVVEYLPEFGRHGKQWITLRHILTHQAGIPAVPASPGRDLLDLVGDRQQIVDMMVEARPIFAPGRRLAYHALTGGFVIGEVVHRVTGRSIREVLNSEILEPIGMRNLSYGVAPEEIDSVAQNAATGPKPGRALSWLIRRALGLSYEDAIRISNEPRFLTGVVPAGNCIGTAEEGCRFFELLRQGGVLDGVRVFDGRTVRRAVGEQTFYELDLTLGIPIRYGMGFMLGSGLASVYGPRTGSAFGHLGFTNVLAWADPERELSACLMTSGKPFLSASFLKWPGVMWTVAKRIPRTGPRRPGWAGDATIRSRPGPARRQPRRAPAATD